MSTPARSTPLVPPADSSPAAPATDLLARPSSRRRIYLVVGAVAVVAILVLSLMLTGVIPGLKSTSKGSATPLLTYSAARPLADSAAKSAPHGPWTFYSAAGYDLSSNASLWWLNLSLTGGGGPWSGVQYLTAARPGVPAFHGEFSSGVAPWWIFRYVNGSSVGNWNATVYLTVIVANGTATAIAISWDGFESMGTEWETMVGAPTLDSPDVMTTALAVNTSFIAANPNLNASIGVRWGPLLSANPGSFGWLWEVDFSACSPFAQGSAIGSNSYNTTVLGVFINDTTGAPYGDAMPESLPCSVIG